MPKIDKTYLMLAGALLLLAILCGGRPHQRSGGTGGGGTPSYSQGR